MDSNSLATVRQRANHWQLAELGIRDVVMSSEIAYNASGIIEMPQEQWTLTHSYIA
jgi:hypothetical protein